VFRVNDGQLLFKTEVIGQNVYGAPIYRFDPLQGITITSIDPPVENQTNWSSIRRSHLGIAFNAPFVAFVAAQIRTFLEKFKEGENTLGVKVASQQVDSIAHSMGGLI